MVRANKSTPNENAFRTLLFGAVCAILILVGLEPSVRAYDRWLRPQPWLQASVEVVPMVGQRPSVRYQVVTQLHLRGRWRAWIQYESGRRGCGGQGPGTYTPAAADARLWNWTAWLGADCAEPIIPYRLCVSHDVNSPSGIQRDFGPSCSPLHDPRETAGD